MGLAGCIVRVLDVPSASCEDVLKIDCEGCEWDLFSMLPWEQLRIGQLLIEIHDQKGAKKLPQRLGCSFPLTPSRHSLTCAFCLLYLVVPEPLIS